MVEFTGTCRFEHRLQSKVLKKFFYEIELSPAAALELTIPLIPKFAKLKES
jgi:hypothetical protein